MDEEWRDIAGYEGMYQVSNIGRVKSLARQIETKTGPHMLRERFIKLLIYKSGHVFVGLSKNGVKRKMPVHQLVLSAFIGNKPEQKMECNHKDGNPANNHVSNLEWVTRSQNVIHAYRILGRVKNNVKLTQNEVDNIRSLYSSGCLTQLDIAKAYHVSDSTICLIVNHRTWIIRELLTWPY